MKENCFDEGLLQAFWDNELNSEISQKVAQHVAVCDFCAALLANIEEETVAAFSALESEFNALVPTQRLWAKINESIEAEQRRRGVWQKFWSSVSAFALQISNPATPVIATLLLIFASLAVWLSLKPDGEENKDALNLMKKPIVALESRKNVPPVVKESLSEAGRKKSDGNQVLSETSFRVERANFVRQNNFRKVSDNGVSDSKTKADFSTSRYIVGEENYVKTIARLENAVNKDKNALLNPSALFSFEKNLAVINNSIFQLRKEIRKNPQNEAAKQVLFASYQNKIDLLNSVTERGALMNSLRPDF